LPELPEVESVRRALQPVMEGARIDRVEARRPNLRIPFPQDFVARLEGRTVRAVGRRGKYLLAEISSGDVLVMHLGMSGSFRVEVHAAEETPENLQRAPEAAGSHDHVVFGMSSGATVTFNDPRRFGFMDLLSPDEIARHRALGALGPEPLGPEFDAAALARACKGKKTTLKAALSDQRIVAGLGNIYVSEALYRARLSPRRRASTIATRTGAPTPAAHRLSAAVKQVLNEAIARSVKWQKDEPDALADAAYFPHRFRVYDREGARCLRGGCRGSIKRIVQAGRSTFFCPVCQK
jgi:formamidopyrimidine-DNA glycosylase